MGAAPCLAQQSSVPQTALSRCPALTVVGSEELTPGTMIAVSADGRFLAELGHTAEGAQLRLRERDTAKDRLVSLDRPQLPPGITWRVAEMAFSTAGDLLVVRSVGTLWVLDTGTAQVLYQIGLDAKAQTYPGKFSVAGRQLVVSFWPPESYLADAVTKKPVEIRSYDASSGQRLGQLALALGSSNLWTTLRLSPDGKWLAVLLRAIRWPGSARLLLFAADTGKRAWERKTGAEDIAWLADGSALLALSDRLMWLEPANGKKMREADGKISFSEFQQLRLNEAAGVAAGQFARYHPFQRAFKQNYQHQEYWLLWQLATGKMLCETAVDPAANIDLWLTSRAEVIALEESYDVKPPLRLLRSARLVTLKLTLPPSQKATEKKAKTKKGK